jgi:acetyltransferase-like isoleucine patch superfamily enzyme
MHIAENVYIGDHCVIEDAAQIDIGPRTHIGSDVVIFTADVCKDQLDRKGTGAPWVAKRIKIGADVVIGRGAVIFPGVELGSSCTIGPFELVQENVESLQEVRTASTRGRLRQF